MKRILVVDDDLALLRLMRDVLEEAGYYVATLDRSRGTMASIRAQDPDLLILDLWMPGNPSGAEVASIVRSLGNPLPILFTSALKGEGDSLSGHAYLPKPFELADLRGRVQTLIGPP